MLADSCSCVRTCGLELLLVASLTQLDCTVGNNATEWCRARAGDATTEGSCTWKPEHHLPSIMQLGHGIRGGGWRREWFVQGRLDISEYISHSARITRFITYFFVAFHSHFNMPCVRAHQSDDMLSQVCGFTSNPIPIPPSGWGESPKLQRSDLVHYRLARSVGFDRVIVCNGHFVVAGDAGGSSISPPGQTVTPLFASREHTEQPQLVSPVISLPCHMIRAVCNNTQGAGAGPVRKWDDPWLTA